MKTKEGGHQGLVRVEFESRMRIQRKHSLLLNKLGDNGSVQDSVWPALPI